MEEEPRRPLPGEDAASRGVCHSGLVRVFRMNFQPLNGDGKGEDMGCVWQSEYAPEPRSADARAHHRAQARHRKPSVWRRAATAPGPLVVAAIGRIKWVPGRLAPQARWR